MNETTATVLRHPSRFVFNFGTRYASENQELKEDQRQFIQDFQISDKKYIEFKNMVKKEISDSIDVNRIDADKDFIKNRIKAEVARNFWGYDQYYKIVQKYDYRINFALDKLSEARRLIDSNLNKK